jgi:flagellar P-ring protein FlgI
MAVASIAAMTSPIAAPVAWAGPRIKDVADFEGVRENQLVGYGLVVGLAGTGDSLRNSGSTPRTVT